ncbi:gfo/Idh/MocA family oxidoreductase [Candidatus Poribacteria bacterium]|nr:gfo/Idh/MocA family oxidoreductase [Candidatus Poribacteria bacterium]
MSVKMAQYGIAHAHASGKTDAMKRNPNVEFCGIFEPDSKVHEKKAGAEVYKGVRWYESKDQMLEDESISAVAVEGYVRDNLTFARECVNHDKHVWLDKPAGTDLKVFQEILDIAAKKNLMVQLGYMFRYNSGFQFLFDRVKEGSLGNIFSVRGHMSSLYQNQQRIFLSEYPGGMFFELLCHLTDIVVYLLGRPNKVTPFLRNELGKHPEFKDNCMAVFEYDKAIAHLESSALEVGAFEARRFEVYGTKGSVIMEPIEPRQNPTVRLCLHEARGNFVKGWQVVNVEKRSRYDGELVALVADIRGEKKPDRSLDHEFIVQETVLRASGVIK